MTTLLGLIAIALVFGGLVAGQRAAEHRAGDHDNAAETFWP